MVRQAKDAFIYPPYRVTSWSTADWRQHGVALELSAMEYCPAVSPDGQWLATGRHGGPVRLWSLTGSAQTITLELPRSPGKTTF